MLILNKLKEKYKYTKKQYKNFITNNYDTYLIFEIK